MMEDVEKLLQSFDSAVDAAPAPAIDDSIPPDEMMAAEDLLDELLKSNDLEFDLQHFETSATAAPVENQQEEVVPNLESPERKLLRETKKESKQEKTLVRMKTLFSLV